MRSHFVRRLVLVANMTSLLGMLLAIPALASERHPTLLELESEVICPTCHRTLDQSNSLEARQLEVFIARRIRAGDTKSEIKAKLVAQFGPSILAAPPKHGFDLLVWWLPSAGAMGAGAIVGVSAWRWSRTREPPQQADTMVALDPELERRLDEELAQF